MRILKEYAMPLDRIGISLNLISDRLIEHLLKIFYYRNSLGSLRHWVSEVYAFVHTVPKTKKTNKPPKKKFIYKNLWGYKEDIFESVHKMLIRSFSTRYGHITLDPRAKIFCEEYIEWLSDHLSVTNEVSLEEISDHLRYLIRRYPL